MLSSIQMGQGAKQTGLSVDTIRFYLKKGLLRDVLRSEGGYRLFGADHIRDLKLIARARVRGFSLAEIQELLALRNRGNDWTQVCSQASDLIRQKGAELRSQIKALGKLENYLTQTQRRCARRLARAANGKVRFCPLLEDLGSGSEIRGEDLNGLGAPPGRP